MNDITVHFHGAINFFLPKDQRDTIIQHQIKEAASVKDIAESLGPPHTEMQLIVVDGKSVDLDYLIEIDCHIDVYTRLDAIELPQKIAIRPPYNAKPRFVLDTHLGKLANQLRMMGFDTLYRNDYPDDELADVSSQETRILLTRDIGLLKRKIVTYGYYVRSTDPKVQIIEVMTQYNMADRVTPFKHCISCNGTLNPVEKAAIIDQLPEQSARYFDEYHQCTACNKIYWKGSHYERMQDIIKNVMDSLADTKNSV
jgi:uncharacterized protein